MKKRFRPAFAATQIQQVWKQGFGDLMNIKILGVGCSVCQSMYNSVTQIVAREHMEAKVEYVTDIDKILSYGVLSTAALVIDEEIVMLGYRGARKIEQVLREASQM